MWEQHLKHLKAADLKINCSKCEFFKTKVHYLEFLVGIDCVQPLPENVAAIQALLPPKDVNELRQCLGLVGFCRKFIPFFADITICLNKMLWKGTAFD